LSPFNCVSCRKISSQPLPTEKITRQAKVLLRQDVTLSGGHIIDVQIMGECHRVAPTFIADIAGTAPIFTFESDEGWQQEEIALWLTSNLQPAGAYRVRRIISVANLVN
jgi:hypothetical protein